MTRICVWPIVGRGHSASHSYDGCVAAPRRNWMTAPLGLYGQRPLTEAVVPVAPTGLHGVYQVDDKRLPLQLLLAGFVAELDPAAGNLWPACPGNGSSTHTRSARRPGCCKMDPSPSCLLLPLPNMWRMQARLAENGSADSVVGNRWAGSVVCCAELRPMDRDDDPE